MKLHAAWISLVMVGCLGLGLSRLSHAAVTAEHRKQIDEVKKELGKVKGLISRKELDEAAKIVDDADQKLKQVAKDAGLADGNKLISGLQKQVEQHREAITKKRGGVGTASAGAGGGTFEKEVAPVLVARCLGCHGTDNPKGNLQMDTFAGIIRGGDSGALIVPNKPVDSLLIERITATGDQRMPKTGDPLTADEIRKITEWVKTGAKYGGSNSTPLSDLKATPAGPKTDNTPIKIAKATGNEKVSFSKDIAPWFVNLCLNCHGGNNPRSGFSVETFEKIMKGGNSGRVVLAGNTKDSRLWHLVGEQETPDGKPLKMPPGQSVITPTNHKNLRTWIEEGAKFDGPDPKALIRSLVLTDEQKHAKEMAALSPDEFAKRRMDRASQLWTAAFPNEVAMEHANDAFIVMGNVGEARLKQIGDWAQSETEVLRRAFKVKEPLIWRGKLIIFVFKDRLSYAEFAQTNERVEVPGETKGHSRVTAAEDEAYLAMQDIGDSPTEDSPGVRTQLMGLLAEALLQRSTNRVPDWAARGTGLALAARSDSKNPYFRGMNAAAHEALRALDKPDDLFADGTFSSADLAPIGYTLVTHMIKVGGEPYFVKFLDKLRAGKSLNDALTETYATDAAGLAHSYQLFVDSLPGAKTGVKKSKK
jgi:hypothetical protein